ncbi:MAG: hypothetical protein ACO3FL_09135 [Ilumatobacteraceae bacterium]
MAIQDFTAGQVLTAAQMDSLQANDYNWTVSTKTASYTLVAADKGTRVVMNSASATTITVNTSLFDAGDTLFIQNIGAGTCTITAGTATVTTAGSLALAQWGGGTLYFTSASAAIFFSGGGAIYGTATGGIGSPTAVTISSVNYEYLTFNSTGTLTVTKAGLFDCLAVAGGCGGPTYSGSPHGGGGSGSLVQSTIYLPATTHTVTIGAGGAAGSYTNVRVSNTTSLGDTAPNYFAAPSTTNSNDSSSGASLATNVGGGAGSVAGSTTNNSVNNIYGQKGAGNAGGSGGGGYVGQGSGTTGGTGYDVSAFIGGSSLIKAAGGNATGTAGGANTGTGGTGGNPGTAGGSGIMYIRWKV